MTEPCTGVDVDELRSRLPDGWRVKGNGAGAYGHAVVDGTATLVGSDGRVPASFSIYPDGNRWGATWKRSHELGADLRAVSDHVTGTKQRCIAWVAEHTRSWDGPDSKDPLE